MTRTGGTGAQALKGGERGGAGARGLDNGET
jgi:hypothetical protein